MVEIRYDCTFQKGKLVSKVERVVSDAELKAEKDNERLTRKNLIAELDDIVEKLNTLLAK